jgi:prepilin-type processing-associated H-X9-DG protein
MRTAIALLVIIGTLVALLIPAVLNVRDAAARTECQNNLKLLAISVHNYHDTIRHFPLAGAPNPDLPPERRLSWFVSIGPYVEATDLFLRMDGKKAWDAEENRYLALTMVPLLQCPGYPERPPQSTLSPAHYVGSAGLGNDAAMLPSGDPSAGFFGFERKLTTADIEGHASTLLLAIETSKASGAWSAAGPPTVRGLILDESPLLGAQGQFGGNHRDRANLAFADGSVRFFRDSSDANVLKLMATLAGSKDAERIKAE